MKRTSGHENRGELFIYVHVLDWMKFSKWFEVCVLKRFVFLFKAFYWFLIKMLLYRLRDFDFWAFVKYGIGWFLWIVLDTVVLPFLNYNALLLGSTSCSVTKYYILVWHSSHLDIFIVVWITKWQPEFDSFPSNGQVYGQIFGK